MKLNQIHTSYTSFKLRRRLLKDGRFSLFIDHYWKGKHEYKFLKLYLLPETSILNRKENLLTLKKAHVEVKKLHHLYISKCLQKLESNTSKEMFLYDFIDLLIQKYKKMGRKGYKHLLTARSNLLKFSPRIKINDINRDFCRKYSNWLKNKCISERGGKLSSMTTHIYSRKLRVVLEHAVKLGFLDKNPWNQLDRVEKIPEPQRMQRFLTHEEVKKLESTPYDTYPLIKSAFLFACFSGLRISDLLKLQWHEIDFHNNQFFLHIVMKKTMKPLNVPLSSKAINYLPYRNGESNRVFDGLPGESQIQKHLKRFCASAGITGRTHFHMSRHTFATLLLSAGVDIYTASKMMGHSDIRSTQIYAQIMDETKNAAVSLFDKI